MKTPEEIRRYKRDWARLDYWKSRKRREQLLARHRKWRADNLELARQSGKESERKRRKTQYDRVRELERRRERNTKRIQQRRDWNRRRVAFKDRRVLLSSNPKTYVCSQCGKRGPTHIHHDAYVEGNPLLSTRELCLSRHSKYHWEQRRKAKALSVPTEVRS